LPSLDKHGEFVVGDIRKKASGRKFADSAFSQRIPEVHPPWRIVPGQQTDQNLGRRLGRREGPEGAFDLLVPLIDGQASEPAKLGWWDLIEVHVPEVAGSHVGGW